MRYRFFETKDAGATQESRAHTAKVAKIDAWWKAFAAKTPQLGALFAQKATWDLPAWMDKHLGAVDPRLMWEFGPAVKGKGHRLVVTPEHEASLRPLVALLLARAPKIRGWELYDARLAEPLPMLAPTLQARVGLSAVPEMEVSIEPGEAGTLALVFHIAGAKGDDDEVASATAFVTTETLLGEAMLDGWIGEISVRPATPAKKGKATKTKGPPRFPLAKLATKVAEAIAKYQRTLPAKPARGIASGEHSLFYGEPAPQADYAGHGDALTFVTSRPDVWQAAQGGPRFASARFSRTGETFAYVKIDGSGDLSQMKFGDREEVEIALGKALAKAKAGGVFGGGTGLRYSYVGLALDDPKKGIAAARAALRAGKVPARTWILFFDATLREEWVGVYPETPAPPVDVALPKKKAATKKPTEKAPAKKPATKKPAAKKRARK